MLCPSENRVKSNRGCERPGFVWLILWESFLILRSGSQGPSSTGGDICQEDRRGPGAAAGVRPKLQLLCFRRIWFFCFVLSAPLKYRVPDLNILS